MRWVRRDKAAERRTEAAAEPNDVSVSVAQEDLANRVYRAEAAMATAKREQELLTRRLGRMRSRRDKALEAATQAQQDLDDVRTVAKNLDDWRLARDQSWALGLLRASAGQRERLHNDWNELRALLSEASPIRLDELGELHRRFVRGFVLAVVIVLLATLVVAVVVPTLNEEEWFRPWFEAALTMWTISLAVGAVLLVVIVLGLLASYHRALSQRRRAIKSQAARIDAANAAIHHIRSERIRLESLGNQLPGFLLLMSEISHRPWVLPVGQPALTAAPRPNLDVLPGHIRFAEPVIELADAQAVIRIREAIALQLRPGWRVEAFEQLLEICARSLSLAPGAFAEQILDTNPAQRELLISHLVSRIPGSNESDGHPQVLFGKQVVRTIAREYREALLDATSSHHIDTFPLVRESTLDSLSGADTRSDQLSEADAAPSTEWNGFLTELLEPAPDMSWHDLSNQAKASLHQDVGTGELRALCIGPGRLAPASAPDRVDFEALDASAVPPVEVMMRLDLRTLSAPEDLFLFDRLDAEDGRQPDGPSERLRPTPTSRRVNY